MFFYSCKEDNNELIDLLLQLENNIDLINGNNLETFVDSQVETISYYDFENNKEIVINDFNSIHNFFDIISLGELEQLEQMPEQYFKMLVSSTMPYPNSYTFIIKTNNNNYSMCFIDEYFSFAGNYYKTNNISQKLLTIFNNSYKSDVNVYNLDFNVLNISTSNIDFEVINNGNNTIYYEEQFELQEYLNGEWIELKPIKDINWNNDIFIIKPQKATNIKCNFTNIYGELKQNTKYRICKTFGIYGNDEELGLNYIYFKTN